MIFYILSFIFWITHADDFMKSQTQKSHPKYILKKLSSKSPSAQTGTHCCMKRYQIKKMNADRMEVAM